MASQLLPLFPLSYVLLPSVPLPLHIFEDRYKDMMQDIIPNEGEFGVVLAKDNGIVNIGCSALVDRVVHRYDDGRLDLLTIGKRRFRIGSLVQTKSYLQAEVEYFADEDATEPPSDLLMRVNAAYRTLLERERPGIPQEAKLERSLTSFQVAQFIYDLDKRQTVLGLRSETERLQFIVRILPEYLVQQERIALAKRVGPQNGHAKTN